MLLYYRISSCTGEAPTSYSPNQSLIDFSFFFQNSVLVNAYRRNVLSKHNEIVKNNYGEVSGEESHVTVISWNGNDFAYVEELREKIFLRCNVTVIFSNSDFKQI